MATDIPVFDFPKSALQHGMRIVVGPYHFVEPSFAVHRHAYGELVVILRGRGVHLTSDNSYELGAGDVFYIPPGTIHGFHDAAGMEIQNLAFGPHDLLAESYAGLRQLTGYHALFHLDPGIRSRDGVKNRLRLRDGHLATLRPLLERLAREYAARLPGYAAMVRALTLELIAQLCRTNDRKSYSRG